MTSGAPRDGAVVAFLAAIACASVVASAETPDTPPSTVLRHEGDEQLGTAVSKALADDTRVHAMNMKVVVRNAVVTLTGKANDDKERRAAEEVARRVSGVRDVENRLVVADHGDPEPGTSMIPEVPSPPK